MSVGPHFACGTEIDLWIAVVMCQLQGHFGVAHQIGYSSYF